jgi:capsular polysaccharide transport system ATP-binding protein
MIRLVDLSKAFRLSHGWNVIADGLNATFPSKTAVGLLGRNGAGKSSLLRMIAGTMRPDSGRVESTGSISWPVGFAGSFHRDLTGLQNTRFIARVYGVDSDDLAAVVADISELGRQFREPVGTYSSGMRARLAFAVSMGIPFDTYLVDEITSVGDAAFRVKCEALLTARLADAGAIVVSHAPGMIKRLCQQGAVLEDGQLTYHTDIDEALAHHEAVMKTPRSA